MSDNSFKSEQAASAADDSQNSNPCPQEKPKKKTPFDLVETVLASTCLMNVDGQLHLFEYGCNFHVLVPMDKQQLEAYILNKYYNLISQEYSLSSVKKCTAILLQRQFQNFISAQRNHILCLINCYITLTKEYNTPPFISKYTAECNYKYTLKYNPYNTQDPAPYNTYYINAGLPELENYDPSFLKNLSVPYMDAFIQQVTNDSCVATRRIWEMLGCLLMPECGKFFFLLQGVPDSGKSLLGNLIRSFYPPDQIANLDIVQLGKSHAASSLEYKRINMCMDLPNQVLPAAAIRTIKLVSGGDDIAIMDAHNQFHSSTVTCSFLFASNHPLVLKSRDDAFIKRIVCIKFNNSIPLERQDSALLNSLISEKNLILMKALGHYVDLCKNHFRFAGYDSVQFTPQIEYTQGRVSDDLAHIQEFVDSECELVAKEQYKTLTQDLHQAYEIFCAKKGYVPVNGVAIFSKHLNTLYSNQIEKCKWHMEKTGPSLNGFKGIMLNKSAIIFDDPNSVDYN